MKTVEGSSKILTPLSSDLWLMSFKDDIHGGGQKGCIKGTGALRKEFTYYFYRFLETQNIQTHLIPDSEMRQDGLLVHRCNPLKIEVIVRNIARGHWVDEHKIPLIEGGTLFSKPLIEFSVKKKMVLQNGSVVDDPRVNEDMMIELNAIAKDPEIKGHMPRTKEQVEMIKLMSLSINEHYSSFLNAQGWLLEDFKFEVGIKDGQLLLIDEISPDCSRIRDCQGNSLTKDLFRQKRPPEDIYKSYEILTRAIANESNQRQSLCP